MAVVCLCWIELSVDMDSNQQLNKNVNDPYLKLNLQDRRKIHNADLHTSLSTLVLNNIVEIFA